MSILNPFLYFTSMETEPSISSTRSCTCGKPIPNPFFREFAENPRLNKSAAFSFASKPSPSSAKDTRTNFFSLLNMISILLASFFWELLIILSIIMPNDDGLNWQSYLLIFILSLNKQYPKRFDKNPI